MPLAGHRGHREWGDTMRGKHREWETQPARPSLRPGLEALKRHNIVTASSRASVSSFIKWGHSLAFTRYSKSPTYQRVLF